MTRWEKGWLITFLICFCLFILAIVARVPRSAAAPQPTNGNLPYFAASTVAHRAELHWLPSTTKGVREYYVYRDGEKLTGQISALGYIDRNPPAGPHAYYVTAWDLSGGESKPSNMVVLAIP